MTCQGCNLVYNLSTSSTTGVILVTTGTFELDAATGRAIGSNSPIIIPDIYGGIFGSLTPIVNASGSPVNGDCQEIDGECFQLTPCSGLRSYTITTSGANYAYGQWNLNKPSLNSIQPFDCGNSEYVPFVGVSPPLNIVTAFYLLEYRCESCS